MKSSPEFRYNPILTLSLDQPKPYVYRSGECVGGTLCIRCDQAFNVKVVRAEILGRTVIAAPCKKKFRSPKWWTRERRWIQNKLFWMQGTGCVVTDLTTDAHRLEQNAALDLNTLKFPSEIVLSKLLPEFRTVGEEIHCSAVVELVGRTSPGSCETILSGEHNFHFRFLLSQMCPCTFSAARGSVEYRIRAVVQHSDGYIQQTIHGFRVIRESLLDRTCDIRSTFACPPTSRSFVSSFDLFTSNEDMTPLISLVKQRTGCSPLSNMNNLNRMDCGVRPRSPSLWTVESDHKSRDLYSWQFSRKGRIREPKTWCCPRPRTIEYCHACVQARHLSNPEVIRGTNTTDNSAEEQTQYELKSITWRRRICLWFTRSVFPSASKTAGSRRTVRLSRCIDNACILPSSWISRAYTSGYGSYPNTALGTQSGYAVSCRLSVSQRQLVPGETLTARLTLFVEDPFALVLAPNAGSIGPDGFHWCALFRGPCSRQSRRLWSPLARAFVSYFLEDSYHKRLTGVERYASRVWWRGIVKQPYRIFLVLRQMIAYHDWTGHAIAEEERDIYVAEMENKQSNEGHLLRVVLEHVISTYSRSAIVLEGCAYIDVSYRIGVVHFKLKRLTHIWTPNEWQAMGEKCSKPGNRVIERLYVNSPDGPLTRSLRWTRSPICSEYRTLIISIFRPNNPPPVYRNQVASLGPIFFMQWPDSCEKDSLPPAHHCSYATSSLRSSRSASFGRLENTINSASEGRKTEEFGSCAVGNRRVMIQIDPKPESNHPSVFQSPVFHHSNTLNCSRTAARPSDSIRRPSVPSRNLFGVRDYQRHSVPKASVRNPGRRRTVSNGRIIQDSVEI
ncbi:hypothetical protein FGIG_10918 [Fasciola gigantica]|uniref:Arrestin-like N-terminal domain-containing protein n=1 Tax=Fasciola gigantica TaxID=46835 RepID=A0A504YPZ7_FASGI|nr:hypothetical protein FGIG_10918 [Fasciola gigantica]